MRAVLLAGALALPAAASAQEAAKPGDGFDVERYDLVLRPNIAQANLTGDETITLRAEQALNTLSFSPNALTISDARAGKAAVRVEQDDKAIRFHLARPLKKGERITLRFTLAGKPRRGWIVSGDTLTTSYFACDWMVCLQDSPGDKALFNLDLWLAPGMASVANGKASAVMKQGEIERHRWRGVTAWSPYIYGFAAGRFTEAREQAGKNRFRYLMPANASTTPLQTLFAPTAAMTAFFEEKAGKPLPGNRYTQIALPGDAAQEAADFSVIGLDYLDERIANPAEDWANAHELAHQWWGNSITSANWQEFWLNEGIVTFMTAAWKEKAHGRAAYDAEMALARRRWMGVRDKGWDRPLAFKGKYPDLGTRRAIQYSKGALFLDMLRTEMGDAAFWRGIKLYSQRHWNGIVTSRDFEKAMSDASGKDLSALFAHWVYDGTLRP